MKKPEEKKDRTMKTTKQQKTIVPVVINEDAGLTRLVTELSTVSNGFSPAMRRAHHDQPLPSRDVIVEIVEALRSVLFPGYFGFPDLKVHSVLYHVGATLDRIHGQFRGHPERRARRDRRERHPDDLPDHRDL